MRRWRSAATVSIICGVLIAGAPSGSASAVPLAAQGSDSGDDAKSEPVPADTQVSFYFGLERDDQGAEAALRQVSDPASPQYRHFPSREQIQQQYGATPQVVQQASAPFTSAGLTATLDLSGVFLTVTGSAAQWQQLLGVPLQQRSIPLRHAGNAWARYSAGTKPSPAADQLEGLGQKGVVTATVLSDVAYQYDALQLSGLLPEGYSPGGEARSMNNGTPQVCPQAAPPYVSSPMFGYNQLRTAYGISGLSDGVGPSVRMAIMSVGTGYTDANLQLAQQCFSLPAVTFNRVTMPELAGPLPEGGEGDLDVQVAQGMLPEGSQVTVLEYGVGQGSFLHWSALFGLPTQPDVATKSSVECEAAVQSEGAALQLEESILLRITLSGTTVFNGSGDAGSSGCYNFDKQTGPKRVATDYPGTSPYVTAVGGTFLKVDANNARADETVWNTTQNPGQGQGYTGGGGGVSQLFLRPWWQPEAETHSGHRTVPDVTALAAEYPGYPVADGLSFLPAGGTSAAGPLTASGFAIIAAQERAAGRPPLGLIQPWLYQLRQQDPKAFFDVVTDSNDLFHVGCCDAHKGYDQASGLGAANFAEIGAHVPPPGSGTASPTPSTGATP